VRLIAGGVGTKRSVRHGCEAAGLAGLIPAGNEPKTTGDGMNAFGARRVAAPTWPPANDSYATAGSSVVPASGRLTSAPSGSRPRPVSQSPAGPVTVPSTDFMVTLLVPVGALHAGLVNQV
jgi:hypothetical protein